VSSYTTASSSTLRGLPWLALLAALLLVGFLGLSDRLAHLGSALSSAPHRHHHARHHAHQPAWIDRAAQLNVRYGCSHTGLAPGVIPTHAVVKVGRQVRLTSFDEGWAIHLRQAPGTLISVCAR